MEPLHIEQPSSTINVHNTLISNIIHENILTTLENPLPHHDKYFQQLLDTPIHPHVCCHRLCFKKQTRKILKSMIQKYSLHVPPQEKNSLLCRNCYSFFNKNKTPKLLVPTNIKLNNDIDSVKKLNELEERLVSPNLTFVQIWQLQGYGQYNIKGSIINVPSNINSTQSILPIRTSLCWHYKIFSTHHYMKIPE